MLYAKSRFQGVIRKKQIIKILAAIAVVALLYPALCSAIEFKGMSYTGWNRYDYSTTDSNTSLANAQNVGCNWIAICVWWFQDNINSAVIAPDYNLYSVDPCSVQVAVNRCHQLGMRVMLKPMVDLSNDSSHWRGQIVPSSAWFTAYQGFIDYWADFATANNCDMFCIGCELVNTDGPSWASSWSSVANSVRAHYSGPITYAANWGDERNIPWWNDVNYIGIDAYYPLTSIDSPTPAELVTAWTNRANSIGSWRSTNWPDMNVMFTEVGYCSYAGTNITPYAGPSSSSVLDISEQNNCYMALLSVCSNYSWWKGAFWWSWETNPNAGGLDDNDYTPQNKPASTVTLREYYITNEALNITNCKVTAGKTQAVSDTDYSNMTDAFTASGTMASSPLALSSVTQIDINIVSLADGNIINHETISFDPSKIVKNNYKYTPPKGTNRGITSLTMNFSNKTFTIKTNNIDLTGLGCPLRLDITMGNYIMAGNADETVVNGPKQLIPTRLMRLYNDKVVVNKAKAKNGSKASSGTLSVTGDIAVRDTSVNLCNEDVNFIWGDQVFRVPQGGFTASKTGHLYKCSKAAAAASGNTGFVTAQVDTDKATFTLSVNGANAIDTSGSILFGISFADFNETVSVNSVTGRSW
jgi:hypothetical protein